MVIDLSGMRAVAQDPDGGVTLQGGCTNWDVYELLYKSYGVTIPGGSCYSVGWAATWSAVATDCCRGSTA